jgi:hypothetical protein
MTVLREISKYGLVVMAFVPFHYRSLYEHKKLAELLARCLAWKDGIGTRFKFWTIPIS